eukprot:m.8033 g.8033  ORF g.8033 m.8033 type:complete len:597 (-) comp3823_c0_seq1:58-1848(-)
MFTMLSYVLFVATLLCGSSAATKSNIVFLLTDDQDIELGGLTPMNHTRHLLGDMGAFGEAFYVHTPICCPSRTEYFSGRYYHNVLTPNLSGCMHVDLDNIFNNSVGLFPKMYNAGYRTGGFGKIINGQKRVFCGKTPSLNGFSWLSVPCDEGDYFTTQYFNKYDNGSYAFETLEGDVASFYQTSQIGNRSIKFIQDSVKMQKPFLAYLGPHAPHYSADSPPWAQDLFVGMKAPRTPAYNTDRGQANKTLHVAQNPELDAEAMAKIDQHFEDRWRAIVGVDEMLRLVYNEIESLGVLDNTYFFMSSDHGYKLGEWRIGCSKQHPYESDVHVPFFARGPGIKPGTMMTQIAGNIDITPTLLDIAGVPDFAQGHDGGSLMPFLAPEKSNLIASTKDSKSDGKVTLEEYTANWRTQNLIEYISVGTYYNDHAKLWMAGPTPGNSSIVYGAGPFSPDANFQEAKCAGSEGENGVGNGKCYFVDSQKSNNWIALRIRNSSHNVVFVESYGANAMSKPIFGRNGAKGKFKCLPGDACQRELYDYGPITSDYPNFPVMTDARWNINNIYGTLSADEKAAYHTALKNAYCHSRRLPEDRMNCMQD